MNQTSFLLQNRPNSISKFFTWFWIIYIPTCILFYRRLPDYIDEFMSLTLILFALANWKIKRNNTKIKNELKAYIGIMIAYVLYSFLVKVVKILHQEQVFPNPSHSNEQFLMPSDL